MAEDKAYNFELDLDGDDLDLGLDLDGDDLNADDLDLDLDLDGDDLNADDLDEIAETEADDMSAAEAETPVMNAAEAETLISGAPLATIKLARIVKMSTGETLDDILDTKLSAPQTLAKVFILAKKDDLAEQLEALLLPLSQHKAVAKAKQLLVEASKLEEDFERLAKAGEAQKILKEAGFEVRFPMEPEKLFADNFLADVLGDQFSPEGIVQLWQTLVAEGKAIINERKEELAQEEAERKAQEEAERKAQEEAERKAQEEAEAERKEAEHKEELRALLSDVVKKGLGSTLNTLKSIDSNMETAKGNISIIKDDGVKASQVTELLAKVSVAQSTALTQQQVRKQIEEELFRLLGALPGFRQTNEDGGEMLSPASFSSQRKNDVKDAIRPYFIWGFGIMTIVLTILLIIGFIDTNSLQGQMSDLQQQISSISTALGQ